MNIANFIIDVAIPTLFETLMFVLFYYLAIRYFYPDSMPDIPSVFVVYFVLSLIWESWKYRQAGCDYDVYKSRKS